ncbi:MAG: metallophosphoesterase family protein [Gemmatimonadaceae bacterium]
MNRAGLTALVIFAIGCSGEEQPTPPPPGSPVKESVLANAPVMIGVGDIGVCGAQGDEATAAMVDSVLKVDSAANLPTIVFTLGDNAYPSGDRGVEDDFPRCFAPSWGKPRIMRVIHPAPGNHDYDSGSAEPYFSYFGARAGLAGKGYYSYDFAGWHIVSLNSEIMVGRDAAEAQEEWLRQDLKDHPALCTLAYFHRPLFTSGSRGSNRQVRGLWDILYQAGADLVLNGHEHNYERFRPQTPGGVYDPVKGIEQIIAGTGGGDLRSFAYPLARNSVVHIHGHFGVLKLMLGNGEYRHAFLDTQGRVWDPGGRKCH